jgi:predicted XRE-type DNA-binding protein
MIVPMKMSTALSLKMECMVKARDAVESSGLTQKQVAKLVGCSQPRISDVMNGNFYVFSIEWLLNLIDTLKYLQEEKK